MIEVHFCELCGKGVKKANATHSRCLARYQSSLAVLNELMADYGQWTGLPLVEGRSRPLAFQESKWHYAN